MGRFFMASGKCLVVTIVAVALMGCTTGKKEQQNVAVADSAGVERSKGILTTDETINVAGETYDVTDKICLNRDTMNYVHCYVVGKRVLFGDGLIDGPDGGMLAMKAKVIGRYAYVVGQVEANQYSFASNFHVYRIDTLDNSILHIGDFAAIHFDNDGFMAAEAKLMNPEETCTADWKFDIRDCYYDKNGTFLRKDEGTYDFKALVRKYGKELINAEGIAYPSW